MPCWPERCGNQRVVDPIRRLLKLEIRRVDQEPAEFGNRSIRLGDPLHEVADQRHIAASAVARHRRLPKGRLRKSIVRADVRRVDDELEIGGRRIDRAAAKRKSRAIRENAARTDDRRSL